MKNINVFLDLDNTLICAEDLKKYKKNKNKEILFNFSYLDKLYIIFERPNLQEFLSYLFNNFNVSIWTAASKDYAIFIINNFILKDHPERKIDYIFFSYHCNLSYSHYKHTKSLEILWDIYKLSNYNKNNTFIIDDYNDVYISQPENCIIAIPFNYNDKNSDKDRFLNKLTKFLYKIKKYYENHKKIPQLSVINKNLSPYQYYINNNFK